MSANSGGGWLLRVDHTWLRFEHLSSVSPRYLHKVDNVRAGVYTSWYSTDECDVLDVIWDSEIPEERPDEVSITFSEDAITRFARDALGVHVDLSARYYESFSRPPVRARRS